MTNTNKTPSQVAKPRIRIINKKPYVLRGDVWLLAYYKNGFEYGPDGQPMTSNEVRARNMAATKISNREAAANDHKPIQRAKTAKVKAKARIVIQHHQEPVAPANDEKPKSIRGPFGYPGGKHYHREIIESLFPDHFNFVDVFGGAANMVLNSKAKIRTYNDIDGEMVNLFRVIGSTKTEEYERFITLLHQTPFAREAFNNAKALNLDQVNDPVIKAHATFVKFSMSLNGNKVAWSAATAEKNKATSWQNRISHVDVLRDQMKFIQIENDDCVKVIKRFDRDDTLLYLDPPYVRSTRAANPIYTHEMDDDHHKRLIDAVLNVQKSYVVISGYDHPIYDRLEAAGWSKVHFNTNEKMSNVHGSKNTRARIETIWLSPNCDRQKIDQAIKAADPKFNMRASNDNVSHDIIDDAKSDLKANHIKAVKKLYMKLSSEGRAMLLEGLPPELRQHFQ